MSDLSQPPLALRSSAAPDGGRAPAGDRPELAWPHPPAGRYPPPPPAADGVACELEGLNGRIMHVQLTRLDLGSAVVEIVSPGLRAPMTLRFAQVRRLVIPKLLKPEDTTPAEFVRRYRVRTRTGEERNGLTVGHVQTPHGVFLFEPQDNQGSVRRVFLPASAYEWLNVGGVIMEGVPAAGSSATASPHPPFPAAGLPSGTPRAAAPALAGATMAANALARVIPAPDRAPPPDHPQGLGDMPAGSSPDTTLQAGSLPPLSLQPLERDMRAPAAPPPGLRSLEAGHVPTARPRSAIAALPEERDQDTAGKSGLSVKPFPTSTDIDFTPPVGAARTRPGGLWQPDPTAPARARRSAEAEPLTLRLDFPPVPEPVATVAPAARPKVATEPETGIGTTPVRASPPAPVADPAASEEALRGKPVTTSAELVAAVERQAKMPMLRMGEALIALGHITTDQLQEALAEQRQDRSVPLGEILVRSGRIKREALQQAMVRKMGYPVVDLDTFSPDTDALTKVPYAVAARLQVLPLLVHGGKLFVAMEDPTRGNWGELEFVSGCKLVPALAPAARLKPTIESNYQRIGAETGLMGLDGAPSEADSVDAAGLLASLESEGPDTSGGEEDRGIEQSDNSLVRLLNQMILEAQSQGVSDIHIESQPGRDKVRVRFRRDGALKPYMELPHTYRSALIARIKIMCDLDISEKRKPQDGKITFGKFYPGSKLELRVATIPTTNGLEDAVMRLLASAKPLPLDNIGLSTRNLGLVKGMVERPYGMFLCVGPTGSGKTTTLHSALGFINQPDRKIWTAEDPIEITQQGLRQVQVNPKIELTFARALRAFLRADPDVIMVGEIRDKETAAVAVESSLTGHLVLSTLHTNSAPETVTRLLDMGMDPFNFADALLGVLAQRLVRRICAGCKTSREATPSELEELLGDYRHAFAPEIRPGEDDVLASWRERFGVDGKLQHFHGPGCDKCGGSGLRGRAGMHELMPVSRDVRRLIQTGARVDELQKTAMSEGMLTLRQDGLEKVLQGVTSLAEVRASSN